RGRRPRRAHPPRPPPRRFPGALLRERRAPGDGARVPAGGRLKSVVLILLLTAGRAPRAPRLPPAADQQVLLVTRQGFDRRLPLQCLTLIEAPFLVDQPGREPRAG